MDPVQVARELKDLLNKEGRETWLTFAQLRFHQPILDHFAYENVAKWEFIGALRSLPEPFFKGSRVVRGRSEYLVTI